jgi:RNA polymerase sigma factor (sigma-70 family)
MRPGESLTEEVLAVLRESDRKMKYLEYDIKAEQFKTDPQTDAPVFVPSREDSLDRLVELEVQFRAEERSVEDEAVQKVLIAKMLRCLEALPEAERELLHALFFEGQTERDLATHLGISQAAVHKRKDKALTKIRKMMKI